MKITVWVVICNDDNGIRTSVHATGKEAYTELKARFCNDATEEAFFDANIPLENWSAIDNFVSEICIADGDEDHFSVENGPIEIPDVAAPAAAKKEPSIVRFENRIDALHFDIVIHHENYSEALEWTRNYFPLFNVASRYSDFNNQHTFTVTPQTLSQAADRVRIGNTPTDETIPPDPEDKNDERADAAAAALQHFTDNYGEQAGGAQQNLTDLLADLAHYCDRNEISLSSCWESAQTHYAAETENEGRQFED